MYQEILPKPIIDQWVIDCIGKIPCHYGPVGACLLGGWVDGDIVKYLCKSINQNYIRCAEIGIFALRLNDLQRSKDLDDIAFLIL